MGASTGGTRWGLGQEKGVRSVAHDGSPGNATAHLHMAEGTRHRMCFLEINRLNGACEDALQVPSATGAERGKESCADRAGEVRGLRVEKAERAPLPPPLARLQQGTGHSLRSQVSVGASELEMRGAERRTHSEKLEGGAQNKPQFGVRMR